MKMKLLDYTLLCVLAGMASSVSAQEATSPLAATDSGKAGAAACDSSGCSSEDGMLFKLISRGSTDAEVAPLASTQLAADRQVSVAAEKREQDWNRALLPGQAVAIGKWSLQLPNGGVIWATEDPNLGQPSFSLSAPSLLPFDGQRITRPVQFYAYNNYSAFMQRAEVLVYRASDTDLVDPVAVIPLPVAASTTLEWDGSLPSGYKPKLGDELVYIARAYGADGAFDETYPSRLQLVRPEEAERGAQLLRNAVEKRKGTAFNTDDAELQSLVDQSFGRDSLRQQNIAIYGSRIRIQGRNLPESASVKINGQMQPVDMESKLVAEYLVPVGEHRFDIDIAPGKQIQAIHDQLDVDVTGRYMFAVALADFTLSGGSVSGSLEPLGNDDRYDKDLVVDGRLAFYLKGKVKGKYLVTAQVDTQEHEVNELFKGFWNADPQDVFRRLDPDQYYPVYGDDSTTYRDVDTQGRLYVRVDWDKSQALWGNFSTGITGTEYGQYSRSLYGGALNWRSRATNAWGDASTTLRAFGSEAQTAPGHSEFLGTGGSLYYLRHNDILPGSEKVAIEIRDATTGRVEKRIDLQAGADYQIDDFQGRLILSDALSIVTRDGLPRLSRDTPLDGYTQVLLVDYEYLPTGFNPDEITAGVRGKHWFGDHVGVGVTYVDENRAGDDYTLAAADLTLQAGRGTYLKVEQARTESTSAPVFYSENGGLSFDQLNSGLGARREGDATSVEARANFKELGWTQLDWSAGAWMRRVDSGYSIARYDTGEEVREHGAEFRGQLTPDFDIYGRYSRAERGVEYLEQSQLTGEWRINADNTLSAELRRVDESSLSGQGIGTLGALQYKHRFGTSFDMYGTAQATLDDDGGKYRDNDAVTVGGNYQFGNLSSIGAEVTKGDRGDAAQLNAEYRLTPDHSLYGNYTFTNATSSDYDSLFNPLQRDGWTLGQRWRLSNQVNVFNESQYLKARNETGLAHTFGMDFYPGVGWNLGFQLQDAELDRGTGNINRRAVSVSGGRTSAATQWSSKVEWRQDSGAERREQWVTTNNLTHKFNESLRIAARFNYSDTDDELDPLAGARFIEGNVGFAYRPFNSTRWGLLGRYTYLYDVSTLAQDTSSAYYDQRSQVLSFEGVYRPLSNWEFALKAARREGEVRMGRMTGAWADSAATLLAGQVRYGITTDWHGLAEYRSLMVKGGGRRQGALVGIDRDIGKNFRVGVGYNFTDFSDKLTDFDYDHRGWFLNVVGSY
ncbi:hypothetical protein [Stenotrophomonas terrae]|nr:hypothetical protein [Stenotrophomonas terrae]